MLSRRNLRTGRDIRLGFLFSLRATDTQLLEYVAETVLGNSVQNVTLRVHKESGSVSISRSGRSLTEYGIEDGTEVAECEFVQGNQYVEEEDKDGASANEEEMLRRAIAESLAETAAQPQSQSDAEEEEAKGSQSLPHVRPKTPSTGMSLPHQTIGESTPTGTRRRRAAQQNSQLSDYQRLYNYVEQLQRKNAQRTSSGPGDATTGI